MLHRTREIPKPHPQNARNFLGHNLSIDKILPLRVAPRMQSIPNSRCQPEHRCTPHAAYKNTRTTVWPQPQTLNPSKFPNHHLSIDKNSNPEPADHSESAQPERPPTEACTTTPWLAHAVAVHHHVPIEKYYRPPIAYIRQSMTCVAHKIPRNFPITTYQLTNT